MNFKGKTAIATGAASGMALLFLQKMAAAGANVVLTDVNQDAVEAAAEEIRSRGGNAIGVAVDVRNYSQIEHAVNLATEKFGGVDFLMNSAGGAASRIWSQPDFGTASIESIEWCIDVNLKGAVLFSRAVLKQMCERRSGVIINMGSIDGVIGGSIDNGAAKSGMIGLSRGLAIYGAPYGVRSVCVSPGPVLTRPAMANMKTLLGHAARPDEVVELIMFLCSDKAVSITGCNYQIDGGRSCATGS
ncbi:SDR family oxidoreductase [uncultured Victivallis sp.]|uniref:SDR family NAD(P)-dependent oxidoreductase n=1 Tax=uncultured Victivallis sp. TaxID=354118 RepID=UPI00260123B8|nr:SDR family oxidoreductase [uncultured Victivallis sp.]